MNEESIPERQTRIERLALQSFRNYGALNVGFAPGPVVLTGENGAGKTNLLEAISLLSPGRGLRRGVLSQMAQTGQAGFAIYAEIDGPLGAARIGTGTLGETAAEGGRRVRINSAPARSSEALLEWLRVLWLTPALDALFTGPATDRRRFIDRQVLAIDPAHGRRTLDFEKAMRARNRLLADDSNDHAWFEAIEAQMAETGVAIAAARHELVRLLAAMVDTLPTNGPFPKADIGLVGTIDADLEAFAAVEAEERYRQALAKGRMRDRAAGRTVEGPHRSDLEIFHRPKGAAAAQCSTGEQKALLVGLVLSHARLIAEIAGTTPILLLDEIAAHLDATRRAALYDILLDLECQVFMTGTDPSLFEGLEGTAQFLTVSDGRVE